MKYLNLSSSIDQSEELMSATLAQIGAWLLLQCYCHRQMNSGKIANCKSWSEKTWERLGLTQRMMLSKSPLWHFDGIEAGRLIVHHYDKEAEEMYRRKQRLGKIYADKRWNARHVKKVVQIAQPSEGKNG